MSGTNGVVHGNLRDFRECSDSRVKYFSGHSHQLKNLGTPFVFSRFNAVWTLTYDSAYALPLRRDGHRFGHPDARAEQPVRRQQLMSFCKAQAANFAACSVATLQHFQSHKIICQYSGPQFPMKTLRTLSTQML